MKTLLRCSLLPALLCLLPLGCRSSAAASDLPCICGTAEADMQGCPNAICARGERNPDNEACVCGALSFPN